jgi:hypothetical protein
MDPLRFTQSLYIEIVSGLHDTLHKIIKTRDKQQLQYISEKPAKAQAIITGIPQAQIYFPIKILFNRIKRV